MATNERPTDFKGAANEVVSTVQLYLAQFEPQKVVVKAVSQEVERRRRLKAEKDARAFVLRELRRLPAVVEKLGLTGDASDRQILERFKDVRDPRSELRACGCNVDDALAIAQAMHLAIVAQPPPPVGAWCCQPGSRRMFCALLLAIASSILLWSAFLKIAKSKAGWKDGECHINSYALHSCVAAPCRFTINVRDVESGRVQLYTFTNFALPVEEDHGQTPKIRIVAAPFRCCNPSGTLDCCDMYDNINLLFCDNFAHRNDNEGRHCPTGPWKCLFKFRQTAQGNEVSELVAYEHPVVWPLFLAFGLCTAFSIVCFFSGYARRKNIQCSAWRALCHSRGKSATTTPRGLSQFLASSSSSMEFRPTRRSLDTVLSIQDAGPAAVARAALFRSGKSSRSSAAIALTVPASQSLSLDQRPNDELAASQLGGSQFDETPPRPPDVEIPLAPLTNPPALPRLSTLTFKSVKTSQTLTTNYSAKTNEPADAAVPVPGSVSFSPQQLHNGEQKGINNYDYNDIHPLFAAGDLSRYASQASQAEWFPSLLPPPPRRVPRNQKNK